MLLCLMGGRGTPSSHGGGGTPSSPGLGGGGTPSSPGGGTPSSPGLGGVPHTVMVGGTPSSHGGGGYSIQSCGGVPSIQTWGRVLPKTWDGVPLPPASVNRQIITFSLLRMRALIITNLTFWNASFLD